MLLSSKKNGKQIIKDDLIQKENSTQTVSAQEKPKQEPLKKELIADFK